jgi:hypothetical protein
MKAPVYKVGDLVRLTERKGLKNNFPRNIGIVIGFPGIQDVGWISRECAKVQWMAGSQTVTGILMLERIEQ